MTLHPEDMSSFELAMLNWTLRLDALMLLCGPIGFVVILIACGLGCACELIGIVVIAEMVLPILMALVLLPPPYKGRWWDPVECFAGLFRAFRTFFVHGLAWRRS
jgi:hypothetical protein